MNLFSIVAISYIVVAGLIFMWALVGFEDNDVGVANLIFFAPVVRVLLGLVMVTSNRPTGPSSVLYGLGFLVLDFKATSALQTK